MKFAIALTLIFAAVISALGAQVNIPRIRIDRSAQTAFLVASAVATWFLFAAWWTWARL